MFSNSKSKKKMIVRPVLGLNNHLYIIILIAQYALKIDILIQSELKLHQIGNILELWTHKRHTRLAGVVD